MEAFNFNQPTQTHHDTAEAKVDEFLSCHEEEPKVADNGELCLLKFVTLQTFDGMMKDTRSFISSIVLYIKGHICAFIYARWQGTIWEK